MPSICAPLIKKNIFCVIRLHIRAKDLLTFLVIVIPCLSCGPIVKMGITSGQILSFVVVFFRFLRNLKKMPTISSEFNEFYFNYTEICR